MGPIPGSLLLRKLTMPRIISASTLGLLFALTWGACGVIQAEESDSRPVAKKTEEAESAKPSAEPAAEDDSDSVADDEKKTAADEKLPKSDAAKPAPPVAEVKENLPSSSNEPSRGKTVSADDPKKVVADFANGENRSAAGA